MLCQVILGVIGSEGIFLGVMVSSYHFVSCHVVRQLKSVVNPEIWEPTLYVHGGLAVILSVACLVEFVRLCSASQTKAEHISEETNKKYT